MKPKKLSSNKNRTDLSEYGDGDPDLQFTPERVL